MKQLKDYLHLYLGCDTNYGRLEGIRGEYAYTIVEGKDTVRGGIEHCKPILRPLSDMTEEEASKIEDMSGGHPVGGMINYMEFSPDIFIYLLSKHFDIFNLIPEGLAIDKTTL